MNENKVMKAEELMRMDWVYLADDNTSRQVDWIMSGEVGLFWGKVVTPPYIHPIPLTPEILKKNGFEKVLRTPDNGETCYKYYKLAGDGYTNVLLEDGEDGSWDIEIINYEKYGNEIYYKNEFTFLKVHELQHALKLCGIKKEIEL